MELVVSLSKLENLNGLVKSGVDGIIFGSKFSLRFSYTRDEMAGINAICKENGIKTYISIDAFINEDELTELTEYLLFVRSLNVDGIYFTDLGVLSVAKRFSLGKKLIYDPDTLMTNSLDSAFYIKQGYGVVLARELTFDEMKEIINRNVGAVDVQVFGHLKMSYSKRKFLTNYFKYINKDYDATGKRNIRMVEETRNYSLPVIEDNFGTRIYTDYCLLMYEEFASIKSLIKRAIIEDSFIDEKVLFDVVSDFKRLTKENAKFLSESLINKYPNMPFSKGYLETKTTKTKEENE